MEVSAILWFNGRLLTRLLTRCQTVLLEAKVCFNTTSINWDMSADDPEKASQYPILNPKEVQQVCFLVEENGGLEIETDGRLMIGQLNIGWRAKMGDRGFLYVQSHFERFRLTE